MTIQDVRTERIAAIAENAKMAFAEHKIEPLFACGKPIVDKDNLIYQGWRCRKPGTCTYGFDLFSFPGRLIVTGDLGVLVVQREFDMLAWAKDSINHMRYFAEKVPKEIETEEYDSEIVKAWISETDREILEGENRYESKTTKFWLTDVRDEIISAVDEGEHRVNSVIYESGFCDGCDFPNFKNWKPGFLWTRACVKWFLDNYKKP